MREKGYIALISVLIISAVALFVVSSANLLGISESSISVGESQSWEAFFLANACAEEALMRLKEDGGYSGSEVIDFDSGECQILEVRGDGNYNRVVATVGLAYNKVRRVMVEIDQIDPEMEIGSWQEVTSF